MCVCVFCSVLLGVSLGPLFDEDLPPELRQARAHLPQHFERQVVAGAADSHRVALNSGPPLRAEPRRPSGQRRGGSVENQRAHGDCHRQTVDRAVRPKVNCEHERNYK